MATTPLQGWPTPGGSDAPANASAFAALGAAAEKQSNMVFADATARDAAIATGSRKAGMVCYLSTLGVWQSVRANAGPWTPYVPASFTITGSTLAGISVPGSSIPNADGMITKTGFSHFFTSTAFGNEYAPQITFATPFPNGIFSIAPLQVQNGTVVAYSGGIAIDQLSVTAFRLLYPGGSASTERGYLWTVIGY